MENPLQVSKGDFFSEFDVGTSSRIVDEEHEMMNSLVLIKEKTVDSKENVLVWADSGKH